MWVLELLLDSQWMRCQSFSNYIDFNYDKNSFKCFSFNYEKICISELEAISVCKMSAEFKRYIQLKPFCLLNSIKVGIQGVICFVPKESVLLKIWFRETFSHSLIKRKICFGREWIRVLNESIERVAARTNLIIAIPQSSFPALWGTVLDLCHQIMHTKCVHRDYGQFQSHFTPWVIIFMGCQWKDRIYSVCLHKCVHPSTGCFLRVFQDWFLSDEPPSGNSVSINAVYKTSSVVTLHLSNTRPHKLLFYKTPAWYFGCFCGRNIHSIHQCFTWQCCQCFLRYFI